MLSAIFIKGFKTFARPVRMPLSGGITAVVGPNGSGKSNITDAIQFALGEGSPSVLRAGSMDDVVFSGSETLPAANAAEVTLVLDNAAGLLSLPYKEVSLTRRISRGGETEYRINGVRSRLADVRAVSGEAGLGRHSILRQGAVDAIVAGGAAACRTALEESAGLGVFRRRRQSAGRRLERAAVQLENSRQLEAELAEQLARIRTEAVAAREYRELESRYRSLSLAYLYGSATRDLDGLRERVAEAGRESEERSASEVELRSERGRLEAEERDAGHAVRVAEQGVERLEGCLERLRAQALRSERVLLRLEGGSNREADRRQAIPRLEAEVEKSSAALDLMAKDLAEHEAEHSRAKRALAELESGVERRRREVAAAASGRAKAAERAEGLRARRERVAGRLRDEKAVLEGWETERLAESGGRMADLLPRKALERSAALGEEIGALRNAAARLGSEADRRSGTLAALVGRAEAEARGLRATAGPGKRLYEVVRARRGYEAAVEAALGDLAGGVLAQTLGEGIRYLTEESTGERVAVRLDAERLPEVAQVGMPLVECVEVLDPDFEEAVARLLGGVYVLDEPPAEGSAPTNGHVVVTRQGMRLTRTSASLRSGDGDFAREARLALWQERLEELRNGIGGNLQDARDAGRAVLGRSERLSAEVGSLRAGGARISRAVRLMCQEAERRARRSERARAARHEAKQEMEDLLTRILEAEETERAAVAEEARVRDDLSQATRAVEPAYAASREAAGRVVRARDDLAAARKRGAELRRRLERLRRSVPGDTTRAFGLARRAANASENLGSVASERLAAARRARTEAAERRGDVSGRLGMLAGKSAKAAVAAAEARSRVETLTAELSRAEEIVDGAEIELFEEWGATLETARAEAEGMPAGTDVERERGRLVRRLKKFGDVNLLAISQEGSLRERHDFVAAQRRDAEGAAAELERMIRGIDEEIAGRFERTFGRVREAFEAMVPRMISGATGELTSSEEGVEIGLRLRRKGWRPLRVLSGGERALLALSFLFGIFLGQEDRGSGAFCVLDEAEAALDDINLARFLAVVDSYRANGQFLLVTHQKRTMAAADVLYGITPDATGASIVVSKRLTGD